MGELYTLKLGEEVKRVKADSTRPGLLLGLCIK